MCSYCQRLYWGCLSAFVLNIWLEAISVLCEVIQHKFNPTFGSFTPSHLLLAVSHSLMIRALYTYHISGLIPYLWTVCTVTSRTTDENHKSLFLWFLKSAVFWCYHINSDMLWSNLSAMQCVSLPPLMNVLLLFIIYCTPFFPKEAWISNLSPQRISDSGEINQLHPVIPNICCKHLIGVNASILYQGNKESHNDLLPAQLHILLWNEFISFKAMAVMCFCFRGAGMDDKSLH